MNRKKILWIDIMRLICTIYIIGFWHLDDYMSTEIQKLTANNFTYQTTYCVLAAFTVLSGFLAANNSITNSSDIFFYYKKKILRLYPLFVVACILFVLCGYISLDHLLINIIGLGEIIPPFPSTLWFMCMLFIFHFFAPFLIKINKLKYQVFFFGIAEIAFWLFHTISDIDIRLLYYWPFFYLGLVCNQKNWYLRLKRNIFLVVVSAVVYFLLGFNLGKEFVLLTYSCAFAFIYSLSSILVFLFSQVEMNKLIQSMSYASMCAYLFHRPIYWILMKVGGGYLV